jgi:hypothetical protein
MGLNNIHNKIQEKFPYLILLFFIIFLLLRIAIIYSKTNDIIGIEQNVIYSVQTWLNNGNLYSSPAAAPFSITQYTPYYYYICGYTAKILGYTYLDIQQLYIIGRSWNILFNLINAFLVFKISRSYFKLSVNSSLLLLLVSFAFNSTYNFAVRSDSLCDMIGLASVYSFLIYQSKPKNNPTSLILLAFTVLLTAIAVFCKQSGIQLIIIFSGFCLLSADWKSLLKMILLSVIIYGGMLFLFVRIYPSFLENVVGGIANGISIENFRKYIIGKPIFVISAWPVILVFLYLLIKMIKKNGIFRGDVNDRLLAVSATGTLVFATVTALKMGAGVNYYVLFLNLAIIFIFNSIKENNATKLQPNKAGFLNAELMLTCYFVLMIITYTGYNYLNIKKFNAESTNQQNNSAIKVAEFIKQDMPENKYIFSNLTTDVALPSRQKINNIFFKNCLVPQRDILEYSTSPSKVVGYKNLETMLNTGQVQYIIESEPRSKFLILKNLVDIENSKFKLVKNIDGYLIYKFYSN